MVMKIIRTYRLKILLITMAIYVSGCSHSTVITDSWVNPDATKESIKFKKVAVFGLVFKNATRRIVEDELSKQLINTIAVQSYNVIDDDELGKSDLIKARLLKQGFDGALIFRLVNLENRESYSSGVYPGSYYSFSGYYDYSWGYMYSAGGIYKNDQIYTAEINIYSLSQDKLIWSGETMSLNPNDIPKAISEVSTAVKDQLADDGLLEKMK